MQADNKATVYSTPSIEEAPNLDKRPLPAELKEILESKDNLCEMYSESELSKHYTRVTSGISADESSMSRYLRKYGRAVKRAKMQPENEKKNFPFDEASNVVMPYLFDAASDFNARISPALLERKDICYIKVNGKDEHVIPQELQLRLQEIAAQGPEGQQAAQEAQQQIMQQLESQPTPKAARADRVSDMINFDLSEGMPEWREQTDKATMMLPIGGMFFRKLWQCPVENRRKSELIYPDDMIYDHKADTFEAAPRKSFKFTMTRNEVITAIRSGQYCNMDSVEEDTETTHYTFTEVHCNMDLDEDGYEEPYIAIISSLSNQFVSIVPRFAEEDVTMNKDSQVVRINGEQFFVQTIYIPDPAGTNVGLGYGIIADDMYSIIDTNTNQMVDAGTLNNVAANSGFIRQGSRMGARAGNRQKKGTMEMTLGKFTTWESDGTSPLQNDIAQLPFAGPSESLRMLLETLKLELREMTTASQATEANPGEAMGLYLAKLNQALIRPNSITVRVFQGLTKEFQRIYDIQRRYLTQEEYTEILDDPQADKDGDYEEAKKNIKPTADPSQGSQMERVARAEAQLEKAMTMPQVFNLRYAAVEYSNAIGADTEKYVPEPQPGQPDPIAMIIAEAQKTTSEAEQMAAQADIIESQVKMLEANIKLEKLPYEIDNLESKTIQNLSSADKNQSDADKNESDVALGNYRAQIDSIRGAIGDFNKRSEGLAKPSNNQTVQGGSQEGV
jgi:hypothetical protein